MFWVLSAPEELSIDLETAICLGDRIAVEKAIQAGLDVNSTLPNSGKNTPLTFALRCKNGFEVVDLFLENGADPNKLTPNGHLPIVVAAGGSLTSLELLLKHGADVNLRDGDGDTAIMVLVGSPEHKLLETAKILFANGADANLKDGRGRPSYSAAEAYGNRRIADLIKSKMHND